MEEGSIRYAISAIKGIGRPVMEAIAAEREKDGPFVSLRDFCQRLSGKEVNKRDPGEFYQIRRL